MPNKIQIRRSATASAAPTAGQLDAGELAINTADGRLFAKNSAGTVINLPVTSISGQTITPAKIVGGSGTAALGALAMVGGGAENTATGDYSAVLGGRYNTASGFYAAVGGGQYNLATADWTTVSGGRYNTSGSVYGTVSGGYRNYAANTSATVGGGESNTASGIFSTICGGSGHIVSAWGAVVGGGQVNVASGRWATVSGGGYNTASGVNSLSGGLKNTASGGSSVISGGGISGTFTVTIASPAVITMSLHGLVANDTVVFQTTGALPTGLTPGTTYHVLSTGLTESAFRVAATQGGTAINTSGTQSGTHTLYSFSVFQLASGNSAVISGGQKNTASGVVSVVGGGRRNTASALGAVVAGGRGCIASGANGFVGAGRYNTASGYDSTTGGGFSSRATGNWSAALSGYGNSATANVSTICGGKNNTTSGTYSSILGGQSNNTASFSNAHIIGSNITADAADTTFVNALKIGGNVALHAGNYLSYVTKTLLIFTPDQGQPPASSFATFDTRNSVLVLDFDPLADESIVFIGCVPTNATLTSGLKVRINWTASTATSGACIWSVEFERMNTDIDADSFATAATGTTTTNGTSGVPNVTEITITTIDSLAAGEFFRLRITRDADAAGDTMAGDAELISVAVEIP